MSKQYVILPPLDSGRQRSQNRLRIETIDPHPRCLLRPRNADAVWLLAHRPHHLTFFWDSFGWCVGEACETCPIAAQKEGSQ